jgi:hypothetical protein
MDATLRRKYAPHGDRTREGAVVKRAVRTAGSNDSSMGEVPDLAPVLAGDASAWTRFVAYYESRLRAVVRQAADHIEAFSNTDVDDVLRDFWFAAVADDMRMLRAFKPERGAALLTWLTFHVAHIASEHIRRKAKRPPSFRSTRRATWRRPCRRASMRRSAPSFAMQSRVRCARR